jgi:hypothetical protein
VVMDRAQLRKSPLPLISDPGRDRTGSYDLVLIGQGLLVAH